jgi:hypothetical protein
MEGGKIVRSYKAEDVLNAHETACFYILLPSKTMAYEGEKCSSGRRPKERLSVLFCCNATGTTKMRHLVIGKKKEGKAVPLHAMEALWVTGGIALTLS